MPQRILLVDDNLNGLRVRKVVLEELGCQVTAVRSSNEALSQFGTVSFDLVVTDHRMPEMDGIELISRIRALKPATPVILVSGIAEALGLSEVNTGANIVIQKSCHEISALTRAATVLLTKRAPRRPAAMQGLRTRRAVAARG